MKNENKTYTAALLALLTVSAYFLADTVDMIIGGSLDAAATPFTASLDQNRSALSSSHELGYYASVLERGLFGEGGKPSGSPAAVASTNYKLIGTVEGEAFAGAVLDDGTGQAFYQCNRKLPDGSVLTKVTRNLVVLRRPDGTDAAVEIVDDTKIVMMQNNSRTVRRLSDNKFVVDQREVLASTENMSQILMQARALPYTEGGKTVGFRISEIVPGSIFTKIGLQNGDIIQRVNSQDLDNPAKFFQLYQGLREERSIAIDLVRGGQRQTLNYDIR